MRVDTLEKSPSLKREPDILLMPLAQPSIELGEAVPL
jgi:hypothetical protein